MQQSDHPRARASCPGICDGRRGARNSRRATTVLAAVLVVLLLAACSSGSTEPSPAPPDATDPTDATGNLYLSLGGDSLRLHVVNTTTGAATRVGAGGADTSADGAGLAPGPDVDRLFGSYGMELRRIERDGSGWSPIGGKDAFTEGLAYDHVNGVLYGSSNGFVFVRSPATGAKLENWLSPPNQPDIEGLAFDPETRTLYGLDRGYASQPEHAHELYALDVEAAPVWTTVGSTGGHWEHAGLAFDPVERVLYATGRQGDLGGLYRIEPDTAATSKVGDTGLASAVGGLAWVP